jgi:nicotinic acid mononucleotide adenylyltransferase
MLTETIFEIEWSARQLLQEYRKQGPLIQLLSEDTILLNSNLLVIQGSFDPPLITHEELIQKSIKIYRNKFSITNIAILILFSLSHVEKEINLQNNSLLGYRISMVKELLHSFRDEEVHFLIGISNVGRYYELTRGIYRKFSDLKSIYYLIGTDVFKKIFTPKYYDEPITNVLPQIFRANYFVAGRGEIASIQKFNSYLTSLNIPSNFMNQISFLSISENLRYESSTKVRLQLSKDHDSKIPSIPIGVMAFLRKNHLYSKDSEVIIHEIIVQITTKIAFEEGLEKQECLKIIRKLLKEVKYDKEFRNQVVEEFQENRYQLLMDRIQRCLK